MAEDPTVEGVGEPAAEPCSSCGFPLAADQRYCLNCGTRRSDPRVDYAPYLADRTPGAETTTETTTVTSAPLAAAAAPREPSPLIAVGGIALLGVMLLIGVLIGRGDGGDPEQAATPTIVRVGEEGAPVAENETGGTAAKDTAAKDAGGGSGGGSGGGGGGGGGDAVVEGAAGTGATGKGEVGSVSNPEVASLDELEALESSSGETQQEASENLPDTIAIPGEAPPTDNEEPGGGTSATVIK